MAVDFTIHPIDLGGGDVLRTLAAKASGEGFRFVDRLVDEWNSETNRFSKPGEKLLGVFDGGSLVAVGGLNIDPYAQNEDVGRLRHFYVHPRYRRLGIGKLLVGTLLGDLDGHFRMVRLRTNMNDASRFYEACGFHPSYEPEATHEWLQAS